MTLEDMATTNGKPNGSSHIGAQEAKSGPYSAS